MTVTVQIMLGRNESTIEKCIASIIPLNPKVIAINYDADEKTLSACRAIDADIINIPFTGDFSKMRNAVLSKDGLNLQIEPWEILASGHDEIRQAQNSQSYFCKLVQNNLIWKETRVWGGPTGIRYSNPTCESLPLEGAIYIPEMVIYCQEGHQRDVALNRELIEKWKIQSPTKTEPIYFSACSYLVNKSYDSFLNEANRYLFHSHSSRTKTMIRYYSAAVNFYHKKDSRSSIQSTLQCIAENPTMAEFWCLLGDIHCKKHLYDKAKAFFTNAIILGKQRSQSDFWPLDVPKYKKYPEKMASGCEKMLRESKIYGARK